MQQSINQEKNSLIISEKKKIVLKNKIQKKVQKVKRGIIAIQNTKNNTIINFTDLLGKTIFSLSAGALGFRNSRKATSHAATMVAQRAALKAYQLGYRKVDVKLKGLGFSKRTALNTIARSKLHVVSLYEQTPIPHNGCRPPKKRRT
jgi:small subunit ribosomal protein S11